MTLRVGRGSGHVDRHRDGVRGVAAQGPTPIGLLDARRWVQREATAEMPLGADTNGEPRHARTARCEFIAEAIDEPRAIIIARQ
ncbi:hypothetical protein [Nocardia gamkensis]|uniref:hypothetical protein n=1 Tax=Nocardia gamkensis TaxID=352869 RepID=UPI0037CC9540